MARLDQVEQLPSYAPELNPVEGVWHQLKQVELANVICHDVSELRREVGEKAADVAGRPAADVEHGPRPARRREAPQALDVPRLARELVGEVGGVLLGDAVEGRANRIDHALRPRWRSWTRARSSWATPAPQSAMNMSHCVSQGSPWVPRKASALVPVSSAVHHSTSS